MRPASKKCATVISFIYLYRDGELNPEEKYVVEKHVSTCPECAAILNDLREGDLHLQRYRTIPSEAPGKEKIINSTLMEISGRAEQDRRHDAHPISSALLPIPIYNLSRFLRPVFIGTFTVLVSFLFFQQIRDAFRSSALENRVERQTRQYTANQAEYVIGKELLSRKFRGKKSGAGLFPQTMPKAAAGIHIYDNTFSFWRRLFEDQNGFLDYIRTQYPELSSVNIYDGLSPQERMILSTEGKALINELDRLIKYGEKQQ